MTLSPALANLFQETMDACAKTIYAEADGGIHDQLVPEVWAWVKARIDVRPGDRVIDIGPGRGLAVDLFLKDDLQVIALCGSQEEAAAMNKAGAVGLYCDMHEIGQFSNFAHGCFARHVLEHSFAPLMMLRGMKQALKSGGWAYIEVPAPGTSCKHDSLNPNHHAVLSRDMWRKLIQDAEFRIIDQASITFTVEAGDDEYYSFLAIRA